MSPETIFIDTSRLQWSSRFGLNPERTAFHEVVHSLDFLSGSKLSGGPFLRTFKAIQNDPVLSRFLDEIGEGKFLHDMNVAGHPGENEMELLASVVNSLRLPDEEWKTSVQERSPAFRQAYLNTLRALAENLYQLSRTGWMPKEAPISQLVGKRIEQLKGM